MHRALSLYPYILNAYQDICRFRLLMEKFFRQRIFTNIGQEQKAILVDIVTDEIVIKNNFFIKLDQTKQEIIKFINKKFDEYKQELKHKFKEVKESGALFRMALKSQIQCSNCKEWIFCSINLKAMNTSKQFRNYFERHRDYQKCSKSYILGLALIYRCRLNEGVCCLFYYYRRCKSSWDKEKYYVLQQ